MKEISDEDKLEGGARTGNKCVIQQQDDMTNSLIYHISPSGIT